MLEEEDHLDNISEVPDDIERVIEGGEDENKIESDKGSGDEEDKNANGSKKDQDKIKIKRTIGPRPTLNPQRLKGPRGIGIMETFFSDIKLHGKGREREDLDVVMGRLEHWAHRLMPRMQFDDSLKKIEKLGSKKDVQNYIKRIRLGMEEDPSGLVRDEAPDSPPPAPTEDLFDQLLTSSVPSMPANTEITTEQRDQMLRNRLLAEERRAARIKKAQEMKLKFLAERASDSQTANSQEVEKIPEQTEHNVVQFDSQDNNEIDTQMEVDETVRNANSAESEEIPENITENLSHVDSRRNSECDVGMEVDSEELEVQSSNADPIIEAEKNINDGEVNVVHVKEVMKLSDISTEKSENHPDILEDNNITEVQGSIADSIKEAENNMTDGEVSEVSIKKIEKHPDIPKEKSENQADILVEDNNIMEVLGSIADPIIESEKNTTVEVSRGPLKGIEKLSDISKEISENHPDILVEDNNITEVLGSIADPIIESEKNTTDEVSRVPSKEIEKLSDISKEISENQLDILVEENNIMEVQGNIADPITDDEKNMTDGEVAEVPIKETEKLSDITKENSKNQPDTLEEENNINSDILVESGEIQSNDAVKNGNNPDSNQDK